MPARRLPTSSAVGVFLKSQRQRLGYTLREVADLSESRGNLIPFSTLARIEQGRLDPGLPRLQLLLRIYNVPIQAAGDLLELEEMAGELPEEDDHKKLYDMVVEESGKGNIRGALAAVMAMKRSDRPVDPLLRQKALVALSSFSASLGRFHFAKHVIDEVLLEPPHPDVLPAALVQASRCWKSLGGHEVALALVARAESVLDETTKDLEIAYVHHEKASVLNAFGNFPAAEKAIGSALDAYKRAKNHIGFSRALGTRAEILLRANRLDEALLAAQAGRAFAKRHGLKVSLEARTFEEVKVDLALGRPRDALRLLSTVLAQVLVEGDDASRFHTHYYLWRTYEALGDQARARSELDLAAALLDRFDEVSAETRHARQVLSARSKPKGPRFRED